MVYTRAFLGTPNMDPDTPTTKHSWDFNATLENNGNTTAQNAIFCFGVKELPQQPTEQQFIGRPELHSNSIASKTNAYIGPISVPGELIFGIDLGPVIKPR
jgi:hypothetical protein